MQRFKECKGCVHCADTNCPKYPGQPAAPVRCTACQKRQCDGTHVGCPSYLEDQPAAPAHTDTCECGRPDCPYLTKEEADRLVNGLQSFVGYDFARVR